MLFLLSFQLGLLCGTLCLGVFLWMDHKLMVNIRKTPARRANQPLFAEVKLPS